MKYTTEQAYEQFSHFVDSHHGQYSAQVFAQKLDFKQVSEISEESWNILLAGPDHADYVEVWANELEGVIVTDKEGKKWLVYENEGIYLYPYDIHDQIDWDQMY